MHWRLLSKLVLQVGAVAVIASLVGLLVWQVTTKEAGAGLVEAVEDGETPMAPPLELPALEGRERISLASFTRERKAVVLNFWASWCVPCREEAPLLERSWQSQREAGVLFLGVNMQDITEDARAFIREFDISYLNIRDQSNGVARTWGVTGLPETFFVDSRGKVVGHVIGVVSEEQLRRGIAAARSGRPVGALSGGDQRSVR